MGRLTDTKVRGFMVTETNNDACAQLQPCSHTLIPSPTLHLATASNQLVALYPKLVHFYRFHKARKREVLPSDLCLNQLQIPLTLALKSGLTHPPSLGTQGIYTKIYTVDTSGIQVSKQKKTIYRSIWKMIKKLHTE